MVKNPPDNLGAAVTWVQSLGQEDPLEEKMGTHSSILDWRIPWTVEPGGLQSTESQRVGHDRATEYPCNMIILPDRSCKFNRQLFTSLVAS